MSRGILALLLLSLVCGCARTDPEFHELNGSSMQFSDLHGRWIAINYWAIWCEPCREEIPELNRLAKEEGGRIALLGVNFDLPPLDVLRKQAAALDVGFPVLVDDPWQHLGYARPDVLPTTYLIGPDGKLVTALIGPQTEKSILAAIEGDQKGAE